MIDDYYQIKDFAKVKGGKRLPKGQFVQDSQTGHPYIRVTDMTTNGLDTSDIKYVPEGVFEKISRYTISANDVYVSNAGTVGFVGKVPTYLSGASLTENSAKITDINTNLVNQDYLINYLRSYDGQYQIKSRVGGSSQPKLALDRIETISVPKLPIDQQSQIATVISNYDVLIENNDKRIKILEEMAQRLYNEWFVKFKFPGNDKVKIVKGLPNDWEYKRIDEIAQVIRGASYSSEQINDNYGDYYLVNLKSFNRGGGFRHDGEKYFSGTIGKDQLLIQGDIVVAVTDMTTDRAVIARPARIPHINNQKITFSADVVRIIPEKIPPTFTYYCLLDYRFTETTKHKANGANVLHLKPQAISEYKILVPTQDLMEKFENMCVGMANLVDKLSEKNEKLTKIRDLLIPQLVTGKRELKYA